MFTIYSPLCNTFATITKHSYSRLWVHVEQHLSQQFWCQTSPWKRRLFMECCPFISILTPLPSSEVTCCQCPCSILPRKEGMSIVIPFKSGFHSWL